MRKILFSFLVVSFAINYSIAQKAKIKTSNGIAQIRVEQNMTKDEALQKVEQLAIIDAIINAFGQYVGQEANISVYSGKSKFNIIGTTKVKGEWIKELDKSFSEDSREEKGQYGTVNTQWITCSIKGRIKEATPKANIETHALSYPNLASKTSLYKSGDDFYLYFKSPINGYLSIYFDDGKNIFKILPYNDMVGKSTVFVNADKEYIFFSKTKENNYFNNNVDEIELFTPLTGEVNTLRILFSEDNYYKPGLSASKKNEEGYTIPKSLSRKQFEEWLADNKTALEDFVDAQIHIEILGE
jgi:hypothetical protein